MRLSIIIPAYNEEKRIEEKLAVYSKYLSNLMKEKKIDYEILVVINATKDKTLEIVKRFSKSNSNIRYLNLEKGGKGYAIIEGFKDALKRKNDFIGFVDADLATSPEAYYNLLTSTKDADGVIASRYLKSSVVDPKPTIQRIFASRIYNFLLRLLFSLPYRDTQCGAKIFRRAVLEKIIPSLTITQWAIDIDLIYNARKAGFKIKEAPTVWSDRAYSTINFMQAGPWMALAAVRLRLINSPLNFIVKIYDKTLGKVVHKK